MPAADLLTRTVANVIPKTLAESKLASGKPIRIYWGIDPTGSRIHLGHAVPLRKLKAFVDAGHEVILLIGSFTAMIGDPTGRDAMREVLTKSQVKENFTNYTNQASKILDFSKVQIRYNDEWLEKLSFSKVVELASHFTVQQMLQRDMFKKRTQMKVKCPKCKSIVVVADSTEIAQAELPEGALAGSNTICPSCKTKFSTNVEDWFSDPIHLHEFLYPLMVGYDSVVLDVDCELGGSDQEFNMLAGRTLQKAFGKREKFVLTTKLLEGTDGRKMSKTYDNCVYLDDTPKEMFGKLMSLKDELITNYFECCTDVSTEEIAAMEKEMKKGANPKEFKVRLAHAITALYHGAAAADAAKAEFDNVFAKGALPEDMPEISVQKNALLLDVLVEHKLIASKSEGRRLMEQKGIMVNDLPVTKIDAVVEEGIVRVGKRRFVKLIL